MVLARGGQVAIWAGLIFLLSSFSNPPGQTGQEWWSQLGHFSEYLVLGLLLARLAAVARPEWAPVPVMLGAWLAASLYGMSDEWHQSFVPGRDANWLDVWTDSAGAAAGALGWRCGARALTVLRRRPA